MTSNSKTSAHTVTLTRSQIEDILVLQMGWEYIDVTAFWRLAQKISVARPE